MPAAQFTKAWQDGFVAIVHYAAAIGKLQTLPKDSVDSAQSKTTNLGNQYLHDGVWIKTVTKKGIGENYFIFIPQPGKIQERKPGTSGLWREFIVQHASGFRQSLVPDSVLSELAKGVTGD